MVEAQKESLLMIIWSIILFQVEKNISELVTISTRVSCVFAYKKSYLGMDCCCRKTLTTYMWNVSYLKF